MKQTQWFWPSWEKPCGKDNFFYEDNNNSHLRVELEHIHEI